jgi:ATP-binding cassette subfamily B protein
VTAAAPTTTHQDVEDELLIVEDGTEYADQLQALTLGQMARRVPQLAARAVVLAWRVDRRSTAGLLASQLVSGVAQATGLLAMTGTIAALFSLGNVVARLESAWVSVLVLVATAGLRAVLGIVTNWLALRLIPVVKEEAEVMFAEAAVNVELSAFDNPGFRDRKEAAERGAEWAGELFNNAQQLIAATVSLIAGGTVLASIHPVLLPLLAFASIPQGWAQVRSAILARLAWQRVMSHSRMRYLLRWFLADQDTADQIRTGTMAPFLMARYRAVSARIHVSHRQAADAGAWASLVGAAFGGLASGVVWVTLIWLLATGRISAASGGAAVFALRTVATGVQGITSIGAQAFRNGLYFQDWADFLREAGGYRLERGTVAPEDVHEVRVENLTYRYDGADRDALTDVNLSVKRGEVVALVGENGSGKTTLSKLLAALYLPTAGSVSWDGADTRDLDPHAAWKHTAVVPQDFARWPFTARQNITQGQPAPGGDAAVRAACEASSADEVVDGLRNGLDTLLTRDWAGGEALSGGQFQRIAIARAFYRLAGLLILDEPTSALDPRAEHWIFANLRTAAKDRAVILVSHRLTNVAMADRIVVLDHGRIIQQGTFAELVADTGGLFHELWQLQNDRRGTLPHQREESK